MEFGTISHFVPSFSLASHSSVFIFSSKLCLRVKTCKLIECKKVNKNEKRLTIDQQGLVLPGLSGRQMVGPTHEAPSARAGLAYPKICGYICGICLEWKGESQEHADA